jgi:hypothetical protein
MVLPRDNNGTHNSWLLSAADLVLDTRNLGFHDFHVGFQCSNCAAIQLVVFSSWFTAHPERGGFITCASPLHEELSKENAAPSDQRSFPLGWSDGQNIHEITFFGDEHWTSRYTSILVLVWNLGFWQMVIRLNIGVFPTCDTCAPNST